MSDEIKQEPEISKKKEKKQSSGGFSLPLIIGGGVGVILLVLVTVIFGYFLATKFFPPASVVVQSGANVITEKSKQANSNEEDSSELDKESKYMETGRITSNPKDNQSTFVVINLSMEFVPKDKDDNLDGALTKEGVKLDSPIILKLLARVKSYVNNFIASQSMAELQAKRPDLEKNFKESLKPIFQEFNLRLTNIGILEFIVQE